MFTIIIKCINIVFIYLSWMPLLIYFRLTLASNISLTCVLIIPIPNWVIYLIKSYIYAFYSLYGPVSSTYH